MNECVRTSSNTRPRKERQDTRKGRPGQDGQYVGKQSIVGEKRRHPLTRRSLFHVSSRSVCRCQRAPLGRRAVERLEISYNTYLMPGCASTRRHPVGASPAMLVRRGCPCFGSGSAAPAAWHSVRSHSRECAVGIHSPVTSAHCHRAEAGAQRGRRWWWRRPMGAECSGHRHDCACRCRGWSQSSALRASETASSGREGEW